MTRTSIAPWLATSQWPTVPIRLVARLGSGHTPSRSSPEYWENCTVPWVTLADVWQLRSGTASVISDTREKISALGLANSSAVIHPAGTVILSRTASVGFSAIMGSDMATSQDFATWTCGPRLDPKFLLHALRGMSPDLKRVATGSTHKTIYMPDIEQLRVPLPPLKEQRRIADFLDAETARIDALTRAYVQLRELMSERSQNVIDAEIERHQDLTPFRYAVRFREGPGIMAVDFHDEGIPLIRISGLQRGEVTLNGCNFLDPEKVSRQWSQFRLKLGDRLISGSATMGGVSVVKDPAVVGAIPYTGLIILRPARQTVDMKYVEAFLRSSLFSRQIDVLKTGATMQHFGPTHLSQIQVPMPSPQEQLRIVENVKAALAHAGRCDDLADRQLALLAERRQALITAAVTGQFDVSTASGRNVTDGVSA
ncbi:restriction endonuclease subunit S [Streptomyces sp. NPDC059766]|uniref:restriction endonuclease subunit S n=1 Tax=Streptomyces sp. NPDC059766 TaxID=3346940 RepID=UPI003659621C